MISREFGEWLKAELNRVYFIEKSGWAPERAERVADQLQAGRPSADRLEVVVYLGDRGWTFTAPGPYIFFCRRLLERCPTDAACAFVIAHEIAHHDLGHIGQIPNWVSSFAVSRGAWAAVALSRAAERRFYGPELDAHADRHAMDLCLRAGYDPRDALAGLQAMRSLLKELGAQDAVYGPDFQAPTTDDDVRSLVHQVRLWAWQRAKGYFSIDRRDQLLRAYIETMMLPEQRMPAPTRPPDDVPEPTWAPSAPAPDVARPAPDPSEEVVIVRESGAWRCRRAPHGAIAFFAVGDDEVRMLGKGKRSLDRPLVDVAEEAIGRVFRRWWRGRDDRVYRVDRDGDRVAVVSSLPAGSLVANEHLESVLLGPAVGGEAGLPWEGLGVATSAELSAALLGKD